MITSYILVLALSGWLLSFLLIYVSKRFGKLFGNPLLISPGFVLLLPLIGFLVVVDAPSPVLIGCLLLAGAHLTRTGGYLPRIATWGVPLVAGMLAGSHVLVPPIAHMPAIVLQLGALLVLFAYTWSADYLPNRLSPTSFHVLACSLPLLAAPFLGAPSSIAVDIVILASVLFGALMISDSQAVAAIARQPLGLLLGWLTVIAAAHSAWLPALASLLIYAGLLGKTLLTPSQEVTTHAP